MEFAQLLVWFALQQEDYDIALAQSQSIDRKTHDQDGQINNLAGICLNNKQYDIAKQGYAYILDKGKSSPYYGQALTGSLKADYLKLKAANSTDKNAYERLTKRIEEAYTEVNSNDLAKLTLIQADIMTYQLDKSEEAIDMLKEAIETVGGLQDKAELKLKLGDVYLYKDEVWEATLLYSQVDKSRKEEPLGHEARFKNAQLRYFIGEYEWAESQLKVLKAATSKPAWLVPTIGSISKGKMKPSSCSTTSLPRATKLANRMHCSVKARLWREEKILPMPSNCSFRLWSNIQAVTWPTRP